MQRVLILLFFVLILSGNVSGVCEKSQVEINSASLEELDEIIHVGETVAGYIIDARPFNSIDELVNVKYFSEGYIEDIKSQGLACVEDYDEDKENKENSYAEKNSKEVEEIILDKKYPKEITLSSDEESEPIQREVISLGAKNIKTKTNKEVGNKKNYAWLYLVSFCFFLGLLYLIKGKMNVKNEFR